MISNILRRCTRFAIVPALATAAFAVGTGSALADDAPPQACGSTQPGPCTETDHFSNEDGLQPPLGDASNATNCPSWVTADWVLLSFAGNGVEHVTVNKAQDGWFTSTFTGDGTVTFYPTSSLANLVFDDQGNLVSYDIVGPADKVVTGHLTNWFGGSFNNKSAVSHGTIDLTGTDQADNAVSVHDNQHASWTPGQNPMTDPPHTAFNNVVC